MILLLTTKTVDGVGVFISAFVVVFIPFCKNVVRCVAHIFVRRHFASRRLFISRLDYFFLISCLCLSGNCNGSLTSMQSEVIPNGTTISFSPFRCGKLWNLREMRIHSSSSLFLGVILWGNAIQGKNTRVGEKLYPIGRE